MAYRYDPDLEFLKNCENEDLRILVDYLTKDKDGEVRWTESLTYSEPYKQFYPHNISKMFPSIASIINIFRGGIIGKTKCKKKFGYDFPFLVGKKYKN